MRLTASGKRVGRPPGQRKPAIERLWARVDRSAGPDGCWPFMGARSPMGYGKLGGDGRNTVLAHRLALSSSGVEVPADREVCHRCDNPPCCNPAHLFVGDHAANMDDMARKGRAGRTKLRPEAVLEIRRRVAAGEARRALAREFGVSQRLVQFIERGVARRVVEAA